MSDNANPYDDPAFRTDREHRRGGKGSCLFGCLVGCGIAALMVVLAGGALFWFGYRMAKEGVSQDPVKVEQWAKEIVPCTIPEGYQGKFGFSFTVFGYGAKIAVIAPEGVDLEAGHLEPEKHTFFVLFGAIGLDEDDAAGQFQQQRQEHGLGRDDPADRSTKVEIVVDGQKRSALKSEWLKGDEVEAVSYELMLKPGVVLTAHGPGKEFDQKAFDALIGSINLAPAGAEGAAP